MGLVCLMLAVWLYMGRLGSTPAFRDVDGAVVKGSIAEMQRIRLGGVDQSIVIRGRDSSAPILIWLHGGPGQDETGMWRHYNAALEDHFLVVYWTQRGTGRSFDDNISPASMRLGQFVADLDGLIAMLKTRFHRDKVVLSGHSWGTSIGVAYAQAHPGNVAALVATGQVVSAVEGERRSYKFTMDEARRRGNQAAIKELIAIGPPPYPIAALLRQRDWLDKFGGAWRTPHSLASLMLTSFRAHEVTIWDGLTFQPGQKFSQDLLAGDIARVDWLHSATHFQMPVFMAAGRHDHNTDATLQKLYFDRLEAPYKQFKWFANSAHSPMFEEPALFNAFMIDEVRPRIFADRPASAPAPRAQSQTANSR